MNNAIDVGVITNDQGPHLSAYFSSLKNIEQVRHVALADPSGKIAAQAKASLGEKFVGDYKDTAGMLNKHQPQMALVTLEAALAPQQIDAALEAGCHVLAEKPSCVRPEDFAALVKKAEAKHLHLMLALANRIHDSVQKAKELVSEGKLGALYGMELHLMADQTRLTRAAYQQSWFADRQRAGGGHLIWLGIHWLDLAMYITGRNIQQVAAFTEVVGGQPIKIEDAAAVAMQFEGGALGTMLSGYFLDRGYHSHIKLWGRHGWLELAAVEEQPLTWYSTQEPGTPKVQKWEYPPGRRGYEPFVRECVKASADEKVAPPVTAQESLRVLETVFACYQAARTGQTQKVG